MVVADEDVPKTERRRSMDAGRGPTSPRREQTGRLFPIATRGESSSQEEMMNKASSSAQLQRPKSRGPLGKSKESSATDLPRLEDTTRVDRLIREREQLRRNRSFSILDGDDMKSEVSTREDFDQKNASDLGQGEKQPSSIGMDGPDNVAQALVGQTNRLIIAANRLPVSVKKGEDGKWGLTISSGGLVSALLGVGKSYGMLWVGWPGVFIDEGPDRDALTETLLEKRCLPIWLTRNQVELYLSLIHI